MARPQHEPTKQTRELVSLHATMGTPHKTIGAIVGVDAKTLRKHYRQELDLASAKANATIGGALFNKARAGDTAAMIFWMKTRAGWSTTEHLDHTSSDGSMTPQVTEIRRTVIKPDKEGQKHGARKGNSR